MEELMTTSMLSNRNIAWSKFEVVAVFFRPPTIGTDFPDSCEMALEE